LTPPSKVKVLKLHGSINWYGLIFGGSKGFGSSPSVYGDRPAVVIQDDLHYLGYDCLKDPKSAHLSCMSANSALILPVANKRFYYETAFGKEWERFFNHLWQQAETALKETQEIVIVGYSLPRFDKRARCLLLCSSNLTAAVAVCCAAQTPKIREEFLTHSFRRVDVTYSTFEEWLNRTEGPIG